RFGISADRAVNYECDSAGTAINFDVLSATVSTVRKAKSMGCAREVMAEELEPIREDYEKRHKGK
ncbi:MAG: hypothetical protein J6S72_04920, partial [Lachnospiraceae bacterium]|nr:hypothetical protein [Lachnospiraceae bacterium]